MKLGDLLGRGDVGVEVAAALSRALQSYDERSYTLNIADDTSPGFIEGTRIELCPPSRGSGAAGIAMSFSQRGGPVWVTLGRGLDVELPTGAERATWKPFDLVTLEEDISALVGAVLSGGIEETVSSDDAGPFESKGFVTVNGRRIPVRTSYGGPGRRGPRVEEVIRYTPYSRA